VVAVSRRMLNRSRTSLRKVWGAEEDEEEEDGEQEWRRRRGGRREGYRDLGGGGRKRRERRKSRRMRRDGEEETFDTWQRLRHDTDGEEGEERDCPWVGSGRAQGSPVP